MSSGPEPHLELLERLRPLARSPLPYRVLWQVVKSPNGLDSAAERGLREEDRNAGRALTLLQDEALIAQSRDRWRATKAGRSLVRALEKATDARPSSVIEGRRLLSVAADDDGGLEEAERLLDQADADVLLADGIYELIAVLPDDPGLVRDLRTRLRQAGHRVRSERIVGARF